MIKYTSELIGYLDLKSEEAVECFKCLLIPAMQNLADEIQKYVKIRLTIENLPEDPT